MMGKGSVNHNTRAFSTKNVDRERSVNNVKFCHKSIKKVYHELFDEALERYNAKQKRSDRKIDSYYEKIRQSKQEKLFHEVIFLIGNKDDTNVKSEEGQFAKEILVDFMQDFQERNPNLYVFSAHLHMDEETPHVHIDFVPFIRNSKRGLDTRVSLKGALAEQGFRGGTRGDTEWNQWIESEKQELALVMEQYGVRWKQLGTHNKHLSVLNYKKQEREKELWELQQTITSSRENLLDIYDRQDEARERIERTRERKERLEDEIDELFATSEELHSDTEALKETRNKLLSDNEELEKQQKKLQRELDKMVESKEVMERNIHAYDEELRWQLPEPGALMSAKGYRDKKALPLLEKLKELVKNLTIKSVQLAETVKKLTDRVDTLESQMGYLREKNRDQQDRIEELEEKETNFEYLKDYLGKSEVEGIVEYARSKEQADRERERYYRRGYKVKSIMSGAAVTYSDRKR
ncbi:MAG: plasmid recombination protein [Roseburia sp.]|jgi:plasmid recombination enzyme|nr:plasmid recombination protein [Roseburia sp.]